MSSPPAPRHDLPRRVEPEWLDRLAADDPQARRTRHDLRRINRAMSTLSIVVDGLDRLVAGNAPKTILDLGAGDGSLMLRVAKQRKSRWPNAAVTLLDRQKSVDALTLAGIRATGWQPDVVTADVLDWIAAPATSRWDLVVANLFVHHFTDEQLVPLFAGLATRARAFFCCEPRRSRFALTSSRLVGLLGAGPVARFDAVTSVHAGFTGSELGALWPADGWRTNEYDARLFSHCFGAVLAE
jgi:hypothetical protein